MKNFGKREIVNFLLALIPWLVWSSIVVVPCLIGLPVYSELRYCLDTYPLSFAYSTIIILTCPLIDFTAACILYKDKK